MDLDSAVERIVVEDEDQVRPLHELEAEMPFVDLTGDDDVPGAPVQQPVGPRTHLSTSLVDHPSGERQLAEYTRPSDKLHLRSGMTVEVSHQQERFNADFLKIAAVVRTHGGAIKLRGHMYTRARNIPGLEPQLNEVALIANVVKDDPRDWSRQAMIDIRPQRVLCVRTLRTTNAMNGLYGVSQQLRDQMGPVRLQDHEVLTCRWHYVLVHHNDVKLRQQRADEWLFRRVTERDADKAFAKPDQMNLGQWRGGKNPGGSVTEQGKHEAPFTVLDSDDDERSSTEQEQRFYSGGDMFAGAGGASRGMVNAGIRNLLALDHWDVAAATYRKNFSNTKFYEMDSFDFFIDDTINHRVDILHLSPPCQYYSPAHTVPGKDDDLNMACLFACGNLLEKIRPRVFTIEQTFGLMHPKHEEFFNRLIQAVTKLDYSVRWKVVHFHNWGLCQKRRRLIFIGVAPGEQMPDFPKDSHGPGLARPFARVIDAVPDKHSDLAIQHDKEGALRRDGSAKWDPSGLLPYTITCKGGGNVHWTGKRDFTVREYAWLQGFPTKHSFEGTKTDCVKQIGNAVPPNMSKKLFRHIVDWLKVQDGVGTNPRNVAKTRVREGFERITIQAPSNDMDDDLVFVDQRPKLGSAPGRSILITDSSDEDKEPPRDEDVSDEEMDSLEEETRHMSGGMTLRPFGQFRPDTSNDPDRGFEDNHFAAVDMDGAADPGAINNDDARSDTSHTLVGDGDDVGAMVIDVDEEEDTAMSY
jgi:DNA (cytosine-5)-methyltransferase 1